MDIKGLTEVMTAVEVAEAIDKLKGILKAKKADEFEGIKDVFKITVKVGDEVAFTFKGARTEGTVDKINEKSFTAVIDGVDVKKAIRFDKFLAKVEAVEDEAADEAADEAVA